MNPSSKPSRNAIKRDLFAVDHHRRKIDHLGDLLSAIESQIDFTELVGEVDRVAPRPASPQGGRPPFPTETMVRILILKRLCITCRTSRWSISYWIG